MNIGKNNSVILTKYTTTYKSTILALKKKRKSCLTVAISVVLKKIFLGLVLSIIFVFFLILLVSVYVREGFVVERMKVGVVH